MPTWVRTIDTSLRGQLIESALFHLRTADHIVVIGYSMPGTDKYLRYLIARALTGIEQPKIVLCSRFATWGEAQAAGHAMFGRRANLVEVPPGYDLTAFVDSRQPPGEIDRAKARARHRRHRGTALHATSTTTTQARNHR